jgi:alpha-L-fucosidase 2
LIRPFIYQSFLIYKKTDFMIKNIINFKNVLFILTLTFSSIVSYAADIKLQNDMLIWYNKPGTLWENAMPIGNGIIGGRVFGGIDNERIGLNETSFWSGRPHDYNDPNAGQYFGQLKKMVFDRKYLEAEKLIDEHFYGIPNAQQGYEPLGNLRMLFYDIDADETKNYYRDLDMETGITSVTYEYAGVKYTREVFVSYPDRVMVIQISSEKPGGISFDVTLDSHFADKVTAESNKLTVDGIWKSPLPKYWLIAPVEGTGMTFQTVVQAKTNGGTTSANKDKLSIRKANSVTLTLTAATSFVSYKDITGDPVSINKKVLDGIAGKDYAALRQRHINDFAGLMGRVHLNFGDNTKNPKPTNERILAMKNGAEDINLEALCFQMGRYMLVSSSRSGGQPATLQSIWNDNLVARWGSKYTININTEMNYWPTEVTNLAECHAPFLSMLKDLSETGSKTAQIYYGAKGWVAHHNVDIWRGTAPVDSSKYGGLWPVGGAWLTQTLWEHYAFSNDLKFLKEAYPVLKGAAEFLSDILVVHPKYGYLVTPFSSSPEHEFIDDDGKLAHISPAPTMDIGIMKELFPHVIEASKILNVDAPFRKKIEGILPKLPPYQVSPTSGFIQEWLEDYKGGPRGHNLSAFFPFYPGNSVQFRRESDIELINAYKYWLDNRPVRGGGFQAAWDMCMWGRFERGDKVAQFSKMIVAGKADNLQSGGIAYQSDGNYGYTAAVAEALIQSHNGEISLLPALPTNWLATGEVTGLRARGGYEVNMKWAKGRLTSAEISNPNGGVCNVRYNGKVVKITVPKGQPAKINVN